MILKATTRMSFKVRSLATSKGRLPLYTATVVGTTYSGHPTKTTLGNSIRVLSYVSYVFDKIGYKNVFTMENDEVKVFVAGDDCIIFASE